MQWAADHEAKAGEEPFNLQLAWEVLQVSKLNCKEQLEAGSKDKVAKDAIAAMEKRFLAEVSMESGNYGRAVEDLRVCLDRQKVKLDYQLPADYRNIAKTLYQMGVALRFEKKGIGVLMLILSVIKVERLGIQMLRVQIVMIERGWRGILRV